MTVLKNIIYQILFRLKKSIDIFGVPFHKNEKNEPFFIVGSGRSGNTLLRRILNNHSELYIPPETYVLGKSIKQSVVTPQLGWNSTVSLIYSNFNFNNEFETFNMASLNNLYAKISKTPKEYQSISYILNAFYQEYRNQNDIISPRWGDKTPLNTFVMNEIYAVFPKSKFIHIIRNPYDSISSYVKSGIYNNYEDATKRWVTSLELAFDFEKKYPASYAEIYYEEMVTNSESEIKRLCKFLSINFEDNMLSLDNVNNLGDVTLRGHHKKVTAPIDTKSIGKGKKSLTKSEINLINNILNSSKCKKLHDYYEAIK